MDKLQRLKKIIFINEVRFLISILRIQLIIIFLKQLYILDLDFRKYYLEVTIIVSLFILFIVIIIYQILPIGLHVFFFFLCILLSTPL